jgi:hypothetical protein
VSNLTLENFRRGASDAELIAEINAVAAGLSAITNETPVAIRSEVSQRGLVVSDPLTLHVLPCRVSAE